jgi:quinoprotein glucose dehydrogenase
MNTNHLVMLVRMIPRDELDAQRKGASDLDRMHGEFARQTGAPFAMFRTPLLSASGLPCTAPPWGNVTAVDLFTGKKAWDVPLGTYLPGQKTGTINLGGLIATAGGLVFSAAGMDGKLHAFDSATGAELWSYDLPAGGQATPMTYTLNGKQYLVLAAGGHGKLGTKQGDSLLAFTLP